MIEELLEIEKESFSIPWDREMYKDIIKNNNYMIFVENIDNKIAGFIVIMVLYDAIEIIRLAVRKNFRKNGIATKLILKAKEFAKNIEKNCIWLEVRAGNLPAIALYKKNNFNEVTIRKKYYKDNNEDAIVMCCSIK